MTEKNDEREALSSLYAGRFGKKPGRVELLAASGGNRRYYRMSADGVRDVIGTFGDDLRENRAFIYIDDVLRRRGINVPEIYAESGCGRCYLQEDLGNVPLLSFLQGAATPATTPGSDGQALLEQAVMDLPRIQCASGIDFGNPAIQKPFGKDQVARDLNYFKYCFMKVAGEEPDEDLLQEDFDRICADVQEATRRLDGFMYRDCQSRNIMVRGGDVWWIDFQGGRKGPLLYDVVSLLWQAKAGLSPQRRSELLDIYFSELKKYRTYPAQYRDADVNLFVLVRMLQVLGAYGFRGLTQHRPHFITSIPAALSNVRELIAAGGSDRYPVLREVLGNICASERFKTDFPENVLTVEVFSFSYKKGYPEDLSGNGGGYMFDCRAMHNPGRYAEYRNLTGRDEAVVRFLEERGEVQIFLASVYTMADRAVDRYLQRDFTHLQFGFGCTGGQHRSVYCAERLAHHLRDRYDGENIRIMLCHREQRIKEEL